MINGSEQVSNETEYMQNQLKISIGYFILQCTMTYSVH